MLLGKGCDSLQVNHSQGRIGWRLEVKQSGVGTERGFVLLVIGRVNQRDLNAKFWKPLRQELRRAAVDVPLSDDVISALQE